jgi:hypothetical protein
MNDLRRKTKGDFVDFIDVFATARPKTKVMEAGAPLLKLPRSQFRTGGAYCDAGTATDAVIELWGVHNGRHT